MSVREAKTVKTSRGNVHVYAEVKKPQPLPAEVFDNFGFYTLDHTEAKAMALALFPTEYADEDISDQATKPYRDKAAAAYKTLSATIETYTRDMILCREQAWAGPLIADALEEMLLALSETVVTLRELKDGEL